MDFMLEEELLDLYTFCLQNPDSAEVEEKKGADQGGWKGTL